MSDRSDRNKVHPPIDAKNPNVLKNDGERGGSTAGILSLDSASRV